MPEHMHLEGPPNVGIGQEKENSKISAKAFSAFSGKIKTETLIKVIGGAIIAGGLVYYGFSNAQKQAEILRRQNKIEMEVRRIKSETANLNRRIGEATQLLNIIEKVANDTKNNTVIIKATVKNGIVKLDNIEKEIVKKSKPKGEVKIIGVEERKKKKSWKNLWGLF